MQFRPYDAKRDLEQCLRIYAEIGWPSSTDEERRGGALFQECGRTLVAELNGSVESFASNQDGSMCYLETELPACIVGGVGTGRVARRQGFAKRLTAEALAADRIEKGAAVAVLGMFDQGFYDKLGFGTGAADTLVAFDPADLRVPPLERAPVRLGVDDWERMHAGRVATMRRHGGLRLRDARITQAELLIHKPGFGLGFEDPETGEITHHICMSPDDVGQGPYAVRWMAYRDGEDFLELMGLLHSMADQIHTVRMVEAPWLPLWDLLKRPWRRGSLSRNAKHESYLRGIPWWQVRVCDLETCMAAVQLPLDEDLRFNVTLTDPITEHLTEATKQQWSGVGGDYVLRLGQESAVEARAHDPALPTLRASVNSFSRLWLGALPASGLAVTSPAFHAPESLVHDLDRAWRLPRPWLAWDI